MFWLGAQRSQSFNNGWQTLSTLELVCSVNLADPCAIDFFR